MGPLRSVVYGLGVLETAARYGLHHLGLLNCSLIAPDWAFVERVMVGANRVRNLDAAVARDGWRLVCLLRASPLMPFFATSYLLGLSAISLRDYMLGTLAALPALLGYVSLGAFARAGLSASTSAAQPYEWALLGMGFAATALAIAHVGALVAKVAGGGSTPPA